MLETAIVYWWNSTFSGIVVVNVEYLYTSLKSNATSKSFEYSLVSKELFSILAIIFICSLFISLIGCICSFTFMIDFFLSSNSFYAYVFPVLMILFNILYSAICSQNSNNSLYSFNELSS